MNEKITLYHGSPKKFDAFQIDPSLAITEIKNLQEGVGIYMCDNPSKEVTAKHAYIYTVEVEKEETADFTKKTEILRYLQLINDDVAALIDADIVDYLDTEALVKGIVTGEIVLTEIHDSIKEILDNQEGFYLEFKRYIDVEDEDSDDYLYHHVEMSCKLHLKDIFRYYDKWFKFPIWVCVNNPEKLKIVSIKENK